MADRIERLRQAAQARHDDTLHRARTTLRALARRGEPITVRGVASAARVSRSWLYRQPQLIAEIDRLRQPRPARRPSVPATQRASIESLRQQIHAYREEITRLRAENQALSEQLARQLGTARAAAVTTRS
ncbi:MAG: DUF6262 family protein [Streptosporangiaceae bacterium]